VPCQAISAAPIADVMWVVAGRDVGRERAQGVEGSLVAPLELLLHVLGDQVERHVAWPLGHDLDTVVRCEAGELTRAATNSISRVTSPAARG
jgi:hypothetical protein